MLKGVLHIHSKYSDGEFTLAEVRNIFIAENCSFVCMTDHAEYFDEESLARYVAECESLSDSNFRIVPGLEFRCERNMHILGYHATKLTASTKPEEVIRHIDTCDSAVSVIAHPKDDFFEWIESFSTLPQGIETWNSKYDGQYAPRSGTFALLQKLKQRAPEMRAFYGLDLHWKKQFRNFFIHLDCDSAETDAIMNALISGKYTAQKDDLSLPSSGLLPQTVLEEFDRTHARSSRMREFFKDGKKTLDRFGIRVPQSIKAQLRRIF
ncbi:MAG TPA: PHP domain-containing protein [Candidatus Aquilonibacter sp.]|jgi:hypothetical protein|nr:PHP domain-containing protein [Candidatus Aquilonibacter sp.]